LSIFEEYAEGYYLNHKSSVLEALTQLYGVNFEGMDWTQKLYLIGDIFKGMAEGAFGKIPEKCKDENQEIIKALDRETGTQLEETLRALVNSPWFDQ